MDHPINHNLYQLLGEVEAVNESNIKLKTERKAREREAAKELETKVRVADEEFDSELTNRWENFKKWKYYVYCL